MLAPTTSRRPVGRELITYGASALDWDPFPDAGATLVQHITQLVKDLRYDPDVTAFEDSAARLLAPDAPARPGLLLIDPWALDLHEWRAMLTAFDALDRPWVGVVLAWDLQDPQTGTDRDRLLRQLDATLVRRFRRRRVALQLDAGIGSTLADVSRAVSAVVHDVAVQYLRSARPGSPFTRSPRPAPLPTSSPDRTDPNDMAGPDVTGGAR